MYGPFGSLAPSRSAIGAPATPVATGGVAGSVVTIGTSSGGAYSLPAGGTWLYAYFGYNGSAIAAAMQSGVAAGGTQIIAGTASVVFTGFAWRVG